jgi:two-component system NarL family sensor kinase
VPLEKSVNAQTLKRQGGRPLRFGVLRAVNWILLLYAMLVVAVVWAYAALHISSDKTQTLDTERNRLRGVTAALKADTLAMLNDGVGAAIAGANEVLAIGGLDRASDAQLVTTLQKQLTGGDYVRFLFIADKGRFAIASRDQMSNNVLAPAWMSALDSAPSADTWVGKPMADAERPDELVIPIARRTDTGEASSGWAGALFSFDGFDQLFHQFGDQVLAMGLISSDGTILVRAPKIARRDVGAGINVASTDMFRRAIAAGTASGIVEGYGPLIKMDVIYGYDLLNGYPLYTIAGQSLDRVLSMWRERRRATIAGATAFSALVLVMTALLNHYMTALRRRERHYRTLFNNAKFSVFLLEGDRFVDANRTAVSMFGLASEQAALGLTPWDISPEYQPGGERSDELARRRIATALREGGTTFEWVHKRADNGEVFPAEVDLSTLSTDTTVLALAVVHDSTARKRAEQDLHALSAELMRSQDEERRRIGRDLHDSTGQTLAALELGLAQLMRESAALMPQCRTLLELCTRLAAQCSGEIRTASYLLHPPLLDELGLLSALRWLADGFHERSAIEVRLDLPESMERLPPDDELTLFRIAQEALTNVHRHSASPWAAVRVKLKSTSITLEIEDAGRGMLPPSDSGSDREARPLGVGLAGMRERVRHIGGSFSVESAGAGTLIRATIFVAHKHDALARSPASEESA